MRLLIGCVMTFILIGCAAPNAVLVPVATVPPTRPAPAETAAPTPVINASRVVSFTTADGARLYGTLYGRGTTAVIFSTMGAQQQDTWAKMAQAAADAGYLALTYNFRFWVSETRIQDNLRAYIADDLRAAIAFVREQGATQIVLAGASLGGMATAKVAGEAQAAAVIIMASPLSAKGLTVRIEDSELQSLTMPKLFVSAERDAVVAPAEARRTYDQSPEPKEIYLYPGTAHGTELFETEHAADLIQRLLAFISRHTAAK
ncbi:MAG: dienelactone hydrolase family protein [Chloroflexi bacterium]|nr:dienelactone hydrolase family protein [Chloroflexota bacterium]